MKDFINQIFAIYGKLTVTAVISVISLVGAWLFRRRRKKEGSSIMAKFVGASLALGFIGFSVGSTILAEIIHRWKKGKWSGEYMAELKVAFGQVSKANQENRTLKPNNGG